MNIHAAEYRRNSVALCSLAFSRICQQPFLHSGVVRKADYVVLSAVRTSEKLTLIGVNLLWRESHECGTRLCHVGSGRARPARCVSPLLAKFHRTDTDTDTDTDFLADFRARILARKSACPARRRSAAARTRRGVLP